jgi:hypothetical protein
MTTNGEDVIELITRQDPYTTRSAGFRPVDTVVNVSEMREQYERFLRNLQSIIDVGEGFAGSFQPSEIHFNAEIDGNGEFKLVGTGVGIEVKGGVTIVLRCDSSEPQAMTE